MQREDNKQPRHSRWPIETH